MSEPSPRIHARAARRILVLIPTLLLVGGCSAPAPQQPGPNHGQSAAQGGQTPVPSVTPVPATPTPPQAPPHALAWVQGFGNPQIWASINGGPPTQVASQGGSPDDVQVFGPPMFSPDLAHIAVATGHRNVDGPFYGTLEVVTASGGGTIATPSLAGQVLTDERAYGWIDSNTLFYLGNPAVEYALSGGATPLPGITDAVEGVVRTDPGTGHEVLFYLGVDTTFTSGYPSYHATIHRYDLKTLTALPGTIDLGTVIGSRCSPLDYHFQGWDASPDGAHVAYQSATSALPTQQDACSGVITSSQVSYANADGSAASPIVQYLVTDHVIRLRISPDGKLVGITEAYGTPDVLSGCVDSPGKKGDPCLQFYAPDAGDYPAWWWDSGSLIVTAGPEFSSGPQGNGLYRDTPGAAAGVAYNAAGYNPWSTP